VRQRIKVLTWNIGGGYVRRAGTERYDRYDFGYFLDALARYAPDLICLQEVQGQGFDQVALLQRSTGYSIAAIAVSPSHFDPGSQLMVCILSRWPLTFETYTQLPNPGISAVDDDGVFIVSFDNGFLSAFIAPLGLRVHCGHCLPLHRFHRDLMEDEFLELRSAIQAAIRPREREATLVCADFNFPRLREAIPSVIPLMMKDCLSDTPTTPAGTRLDYILATHDLDVVESFVDADVLSDHFPVLAVLELSV